MAIKFEVPGKPKSLKRHRDRRFGGKFDPSKADKDNFLAVAFSNRPEKPLTLPLTLAVHCYFQRPKSHFTAKGELKDESYTTPAPYWHTSTPDADNIGKFVGDALNGVFWEDDRQIVRLVVVKRYGVRPCTKITIEDAEEVI